MTRRPSIVGWHRRSKLTTLHLHKKDKEMKLHIFGCAKRRRNPKLGWKACYTIHAFHKACLPPIKRTFLCCQCKLFALSIQCNIIRVCFSLNYNFWYKFPDYKLFWKPFWTALLQRHKICFCPKAVAAEVKGNTFSGVRANYYLQTYLCRLYMFLQENVGKRCCFARD